MINKEIINDFSNLIGNLTIALHIDSLKSEKKNYEDVLREMLKWVNFYYEYKNLNIVNHENSLKIHEILEACKSNLVFNKEIGMESMLADDILIRYEVIIKKINTEKVKVNE